MNDFEYNVLAALTRASNCYSPEELQRFAETIPWRSTYRDENGDLQTKDRFLNELTTSHLENIIVTQKHIDVILSRVILHILKTRYTTPNHPLNAPDSYELNR